MGGKSKIQNPEPKAPCGKSKIPWLILALIIGGQLYYLPARLDFLKQLSSFALAKDGVEAARLAYGAANYDLLAWVERETTPETALLLLTASPRTYGDPAYVFYHRALYHLYPRSIWWAAPVAPTRYPAWWSLTDLSQADILALAHKHHTAAILAVGFAQPPVPGRSIAFDETTHLIFLEPPPTTDDQQLAGEESAQQPASRYPPSAIGHPLSATSYQLSAISQPLSALSRWLRALGAVLSIWLWGDLLYNLIMRNWLPPSTLRRIPTAWLLGCGVTSLSTFILLWAGVSLTTAVIGLSSLGALLWLYFWVKCQVSSVKCQARCITHYVSRFTFHVSRFTFHVSRFTLHASEPKAPYGRFTPHTLLPLLFLLIILLQLSLVAFAAWVSPLTDWDSWVNWASKANALFIDQTISANLYHNPARLPTNMDYPLLLPLVEAWFYTWLGHIHELSAGLISFLFYGALLLLFYHAAQQLISPTAALGFTALLATVPRLERPAHSGLADIPLAALVFLSFLLLIEWLHLIYNRPTATASLLSSSPPPLLPFSHSPTLPPYLALGLTAGLLPWLKNEGWLWFTLISLTLLVRLGWQVKGQHLTINEAVIRLAIYFGLALFLALPWPLFLAWYGTYHFTFLPLTAAHFFVNLSRLPTIIIQMGSRLLNPYWNFIWFLTGLTLLLRRERTWLAPLGWLIFPVGIYLALTSLTYLFSRFDPYLAHLNNSAERLILQATPVAAWWLTAQSVSLGWVGKKVRNVGELERTQENVVNH